MLRKIFVISFLGLAVNGCVSGPDITPCVYSPEENGSWCAPKNGEVFFKASKDMPNFVCFSPDDTEKLTNWMKRNCHGPKENK